MKISIVGAGYVGLSLAALISQKHEVTLLDINKRKVEQINNRISPIKDNEIKIIFAKKTLRLFATLSKKKAFSESEIIIIATPTNYDANKGSFDTKSVYNAIESINKYNKSSLVVIRSTVPFGFTDKMRKKYNSNNIIFSPEFLRESRAIYDNLFPSRIIIGGKSNKAKKFAKILLECSKKNKNRNKLLFVSSSEAEAIKLFSNTYLAMRVAFFNELDSFSEKKNISTLNVINGVCEDDRIGHHYNNPSFGYGGYCLPKDTKQLLKNFSDIPNNIIKAVVESNQTRKKFIVRSILSKKPKTVGIYRLIMKKDSDNFRESAVIDIIEMLVRKKIKVLLYEPLYKSEQTIKGIELITSFSELIFKSDLILANRKNKQLRKYSSKIYSRDLFEIN